MSNDSDSSDVKAARELANYVNCMGHDPKAFAEALMHEHRTLQQSVFSLFCACMNAWAKQEYHNQMLDV